MNSERSYSPEKFRLVDSQAESYFSAMAYAGGHGVSHERLGLALLYYTLPYASRALTSVCLGSGGGLVPELMRKAQIDLELEGSRTYLVDAILPEAGYGTPDIEGGWFTRRKSLHGMMSDIWLINTTTELAARDFFSRLGRPIDILHIDADHSYEGAKLDFQLFSPLLSPHGILTFHDLRMPDITRLVDEIETDNLWDILRFTDIGQGLGILRKRRRELAPVIVGIYNKIGSDGCSTQATPELPDEGPALWQYLTYPALYSRHAIAAQWLDNIDLLIEVGGYITPIAPFLVRSPPQEYLLIDPLCEPLESETLNGHPCRMRHIRAELESLNPDITDGRQYAVVFLGAQLSRDNKDFSEIIDSIEHFLRILSRAKLGIIEFAPVWRDCQELFDCIISMLRPQVDFEIMLDLSHNQIFVDDIRVPPERLKRHLFVLSGFALMPPVGVARKEIARILRGPNSEKNMRRDTRLMKSLPEALRGSFWEATHDVATVKMVDNAIIITTPPVPWHYAAIINLNEEALAGSSFVVQIEASECSGNIYATMATKDLSELSDQHRIVPNDQGKVKLTLEGSSTSGHTCLLLRTGPEAIPGRLVVTRLDILH